MRKKTKGEEGAGDGEDVKGPSPGRGSPQVEKENLLRGRSPVWGETFWGRKKTKTV